MKNLDFWRGSAGLPAGRQDVFSLMEKLFEDSGPWALRAGDGKARPLSEVHETKSDYIFKFDLPGMLKEDIKIDVSAKRLTVSAERKRTITKGPEGDDKKEHFSEFTYGSYYRSFELPTPVNPENVDAKYEGGILTLTVPKTEKEAVRQVTIK